MVKRQAKKRTQRRYRLGWKDATIAILLDIADAKISINIESYIWWTGDVCVKVADALADSARRGVEVRLLLDYSGASRMDKKLVRSMREAGCQVRPFHPLRISNIGRMNNRKHRKIGVFDGRIGYIGSCNPHVILTR